MAKIPTIESQFAEMQARIRALEQKLSDTSATQDAASATVMRISGPAAEQEASPVTRVTRVIGPTTQVNGQVSGPVTQVNGPMTQVNTVNTVNTVNHINVEIRPWGAALALTDGDVEAALACVPGLAGTPTLAEVVSSLMELVKRAHAPAEARNIYINPKRADQALALTAGGWATLPLAEATTVLFDAATARMEAPAARMEAPAARAAATPRQERVRGLRAEVPVQYRIERESAVQLGLRPMEAHLINTRPGGPGPLLLEAKARGAAEAGGPAAGAAGAARGAVEAKEEKKERIRAAMAANPARYGESGALALGWIQEACGAAKVNGHELFAELQAGSDEAARAGAQMFKEEQLRLRPRPS